MSGVPIYRDKVLFIVTGEIVMKKLVALVAVIALAAPLFAVDVIVTAVR